MLVTYYGLKDIGSFWRRMKVPLCPSYIIVVQTCCKIKSKEKENRLYLNVLEKDIWFLMHFWLAKINIQTVQRVLIQIRYALKNLSAKRKTFV